MHTVRAIPSPPSSWASFALGPLTVHTYALCILAGIVVAVLVTERRLQRRGVTAGTVLDVTLLIVPLGIVGARIYHVLTHTSDYFFPGANLWNVFAIWDGGNALYGSMLGGALGIALGCRRVGLRFLAFADALAPGMLAAQAIGRLGNYFNHELFGLPTTLPWGLQIQADDPRFPSGVAAGTLFHPLFLYEMLWNLAGIGLILLLERRVSLQWGRAIAVYLIWYGLGRTWMEAIRIDPTSDAFLGVPANDWASFLAVAIGVALLLVQRRRHPEAEPSPYFRDPRPAAERGSSAPMPGGRPTDRPSSRDAASAQGE